MSDTVAFDIERASADDLPSIENLLAANKLPLEGVREWLDTFVVARSGGRIVGVAGVERCDPYGLLRSAAVDQSVRGHGIGRALIERLIADAESDDLRALYLLTMTAENYFPAFGFTKTSRDAVPVEIQNTAQFRDICPSSAIVMRRSLQRS